jgi:hypothetical protein
MSGNCHNVDTDLAAGFFGGLAAGKGASNAANELFQ